MRFVVDENVRKFFIVESEHDDWNIGIRSAKQFGEGHRAHIFDMERNDHKLEAFAFFDGFDGFLTAGHMGEFRRVGQVEPLVLVENHLVQAAVFLKNEEVVQTRHEKNIPDTMMHQVLEILKPCMIAQFDPRWIRGDG